MIEFQDYLHLAERLAGGQSFDEEEVQLLQENFEDLKSLIVELKASSHEKLDAPVEGRKQVEFEAVLMDQIFYHGQETYFKVSNQAGRVLESSKERRFAPSEAVEIDRRTGDYE